MITGSILKEKREALNLLPYDIAQITCLSTNQVKALEADDTSLFYSAKIRQQCLNRVALALGITIPASEAGDEEAPTPPAESLLNINRPPDLSVMSYMHQELFAIERKFRPIMINALLATSVLLFANFLAGQEETAKPTSLIPPTDGKIPPTAALPKAPIAANHALGTLQLAKDIATNPIADDVRQATSATLTEKACADFANLLEVQVELPIKPANKVYFTSAIPQNICVSDASGTLQHFNASTKVGHVFHGMAPFIVSAEHLELLALFFQGKKVNLNGFQKTAVKLTEHPIL